MKQTNLNIDSFKYYNLECTYCHKKYLRYGAFMNHVEKCKYKLNSFKRGNFCNTQEEDNQALQYMKQSKDIKDMKDMKDMKHELSHLRNEVGELRELIIHLINQQESNNINYKQMNKQVEEVVQVEKVEGVEGEKEIEIEVKSNSTIKAHTSACKTKHILFSDNNDICGDICDDICGNICCDNDDNDCHETKNYYLPVSCESTTYLEFNSFISQIDFCNQSQLLDIFDSDDIVESFFFLWKEALDKWKYNDQNIPIKFTNNRLYIFENGIWFLFELDKIEKMISYLQQKIVQQLSIYQNNIKSRINSEPQFRDYYLNQVTKINSDKIYKLFASNYQGFIQKLGELI